MSPIRPLSHLSWQVRGSHPVPGILVLDRPVHLEDRRWNAGKRVAAASEAGRKRAPCARTGPGTGAVSGPPEVLDAGGHTDGRFQDAWCRVPGPGGEGNCGPIPDSARSLRADGSLRQRPGRYRSYDTVTRPGSTATHGYRSDDRRGASARWHGAGDGEGTNRRARSPILCYLRPGN